jgi:hypothetical protein
VTRTPDPRIRILQDKAEAETILEKKLIEQENFGTAGLSFNERQRAEYLECAEKLQSFGVTSWWLRQSQ